MSRLAHTITHVTFWPIDIPITDPFVVATGARVVAENVFAQITLGDGTIGYGEAAPFPEVGGEDRASCLSSLSRLSPTLIGRPIGDYRPLAEEMAESAPTQPAARCALETALLDAFCRAKGMPLWRLWGGADVRERETDITIPIASLDDTVRLAQGWYKRGFRLFKMKVGQDVDLDICRLKAVHSKLPDVSFIGDGNQGFSRVDCLHFARGVTGFGGRLVLLEQPVVREDLDSLAAIRRETGIPVAADESVRSIADARRVVEAQAADYINIKIMKTGVLEAAEIAAFALRAGLKLMIGGMVETRIAMGCSFSLVLGMAGFDVLDLDTPLLLAQDLVEGGYRYEGPLLKPWHEPGLDMSTPVGQAAVTIS
ncbi:dipeptide epimerase [Nitrospira moscoviensis]|uniref:Dipeptide epimerase n=1 Tax=Nitrospira moscoviensis TaxID=42253 RepID=A0A0K2G907_NITMO|nr:dipeptide epimerase [Nitrospira moscoviensis]ALA57433.1 putative Muconate cycloisomerase [Nitrospira moscoviensis]